MGDAVTFDDLDIFKQDLLEDDLPLQVSTIDKMEYLAKGLGEILTREELLPFVLTSIPELHEEVLLHLSKQLEKFVPLVGGLDHSGVIFQILTMLCNTDENIIRQSATDTLTFLGKDMNSQEIHDVILPVLKELSKNPWFTGKCSAITFYPIFYAKLNEADKAEFRHNFKIFIQDDCPMVRQAAAAAFADFVAVAEDDIIKDDFVPMFCDISLDPLDSIKCASVEIAIALIERLGENRVDESIFKTIEAASDSTSWKVRQQLARSIADLQKCLPYDKYRGPILALFQKLSHDENSVVRGIIAKSTPDYCKYLLDCYLQRPHQTNNFEPIFEQSVMPVIRRLSTDEIDTVRLELSSDVLTVSSILSKECFTKTMTPFILEVLSAEESIEILTNYLQGLNYVSEKGDISKILDAVTTSIKVVLSRSQTNWRSRRSILATFADLAKICNPDFFSDKFKLYFATLLGDQVFAIRRTAALIVPLIAKQYGIKWATDNLVAYFLSFYPNPKYLYRYVPLFGITEMIKPFLSQTPTSYLDEFNVITKDKGDPNYNQALLSLAKITKTVSLIKQELERDSLSSLLLRKQDLSYLSNSDTKIYSETNYQELKEKFKNFNVYSVETRDFEKDNTPYLEGILLLIYNKFIPILKVLSKDSTNNIAIRTIITLADIEEFILELSKETEEAWVEETLKALSSDELRNINNELKAETKISKQQSMENIDTTLQDDHIDISTTTYIENSKIETENNGEGEQNEAKVEVKVESEVTQAPKDTEPDTKDNDKDENTEKNTHILPQDKPIVTQELEVPIEQPKKE